MFISSLFFPSSSSCMNALLALRIERTWHPHHHSLMQGSNRITKGSTSQAFSQSFLMKQRTILLLLSCLFLLSLEITGEPQDTHGNVKEGFKKGPSSSYSRSSPQPHAEYLRQSVINRGRTENVDHNVNLVDSDDITIFQHLTTIAPLHLFYGNKSSDFPSENTASVVASSFLNVDNAQTQSSSDEDATTGSSINQQSHRRKVHQRKCDTTILKRCLEGLPPMNDTGIPSSPQAVTTACRMYDSGINCFDSWAKNCLHEGQRQKVKASITGAHEMFSFLCKDSKFRADFLKHKDCYRKVSPHWDDCSREFIDGLRRNVGYNKTAFCCIRLDFLKCVSQYSSYFCSLDATKFLIKMAETLVRSSIRTRSRIPDYCQNIEKRHCVSITDKATQLMRSPRQFLAIYVPATCLLVAVSTFVIQRPG